MSSERTIEISKSILENEIAKLLYSFSVVNDNEDVVLETNFPDIIPIKIKIYKDKEVIVGRL